MDIKDVDYEHTKRMVERNIETAIRHIFSQIKEEYFDLNGEEARVNIFFPPTTRDENWRFGVDVITESGHIEFVMYQSGFGGTPIKKIEVLK